MASWNSALPVVRFGISGQTCLKSEVAHSVPTSATFVGVVSWRGDGGNWEPIAAVSHDRYWTVRMVYNTRELNMHVRNEQVPRVGVELSKPYVFAARVDGTGKKSYMWIYDIEEGVWTGKQVYNTEGIPSGGKEVITLARASAKTWEWAQMDMAIFSMWDKFLDDSAVTHLVVQYAATAQQACSSHQCASGFQLLPDAGSIRGSDDATCCEPAPWLFLDARSITSSSGSDVSEWKDSSGRSNNFAVASDCGTPKLGMASWNSALPVVRFGISGQTCLKSEVAHSVPTSATFVGVVSWRGDGGNWEPIAAVSHDRYWTVRMVYNTRELNMHVRNEQVPRVGVELSKPYVFAARVDGTGKKSYMWIYDIEEGVWTGKQVYNTEGIPSGGKEVITLARASAKTWEWAQMDMAIFSMWDKFLDDAAVTHFVMQYAAIAQRE